MPQQSLLVIEDDPSTRKALERIFAIKGWSVRLATTVAEGLAKLEPPPDCVILDLMLPDAGGENVLRKIRADGMPTRVTVCTGVLDPQRLQELEELAPDALFLKPVSLAELYRACQVMDPV